MPHPAATSRRLRTSYVVLTALVSLVVLLGARPASAHADGPCADVELIGLRGSGENPPKDDEHGMGALIGPLADATAASLSEGATVGFHGLPYPAGDAGIVTVLSRSYFRSKDAGVAMLHDYLRTRIGQCPSSRLVVMGYSQGAHVAGDMLAAAGREITDHVAALVMFGDPRFNPQAAYTWGSFDSRNHGLAGPRSPGDFSNTGMKVFSFCNDRDLVCQGLGTRNGTETHAQALYRRNYESLASGLVRRSLGYSAPGRIPLDLAFVIDSTGSMSSSIAGVADAARTMVAELEDKRSDYRVGLVDYKDTDQGDPYAARVDLDLTSEADRFRSAVDGLEAGGGGDTPEAVFSGLMTAYHRLSWRTGARKAIVLMGDARAKDPEPVTGYTEQSVIAAAAGAGARAGLSARSTSSPGAVSVYALPVGAAPVASFRPLAQGTGGKLFMADTPADVAAEAIAAVDAAAAPLYVTLAGPALLRTGGVALLDAKAFYAAGEVVGYDWDIDSDGTVDAATTDGRLTPALTSAQESRVTVTARTSDGRSASAQLVIQVRDDAPVAPDAPAALTATAEPGAVTVRWDTPRSAGGGTLVGFDVRISTPAGAPVATASAGAAAGSHRFDDLEPGSYLAAVSAVNDAGRGADRQVAFTIPGPPPAPVAPSGESANTAGGHGQVNGGRRRVGAVLDRVAWKGRTLRLRVACPRGAAASCSLDVALQRRSGLRYRQVVSRKLTVHAGRAQTLRLRLSRAQLRLVRRSSRARLVVRTSSPGGSTTLVRTIRSPPG